MNAQMITRNIVIDERRTTIRLEAAIWEALDDICVRERRTRHEICTIIEKSRRVPNRAQAVRATVINYFRLSSKQNIRRGDLLKSALTSQGSVSG